MEVQTMFSSEWWGSLMALDDILIYAANIYSVQSCKCNLFGCSEYYGHWSRIFKKNRKWIKNRVKYQHVRQLR